MTAAEELELAVRAQATLLALITHEERRALDEIIRPLAEKWRQGALYAWSITSGLRSLRQGEADEEASLNAPDAISALEIIAGHPEPGIFVLQDFHHYLDAPVVVRRLRDLAGELAGTCKQIIILAPHLQTPPDLERQLHLIDLPLPGKDELAAILPSLSATMARPGWDPVQLDDSQQERLLRACLGLTLTETETVLAKAIVRDGAVTERAVDLVMAEKRQHVRRGGLLEYYEPGIGLDEVGGLRNLKAWLLQRRAGFTDEAEAFGLDAPRGVLLLGVQGCGKSLTARAVSSAWSLPLLRLDIGRVFGRYIGDSERAIRQVVQTVEAAAPAILWIDELEKGFAGSTSDAHDTGVAARVLGTFLVWLQEKTSPVFVIATANDIRRLPPELLRRGRFDEIFFVDLPGDADRREVLSVHLRRRRRDPEQYDLCTLAAATTGFTGAELEQVVKEALYAAFTADRRPLTQDDLLAAARDIIPLSVTMKEQIAAMRQWASTRARQAGEPGE